MTEGKQGPLSGLRVVDAATMLAAPLAATLLGDLGAEVIKLEHPSRGDHLRSFGQQKDGVPIYWKSVSRNKRLLTLNLSTPAGQGVLRRLVSEADVLIENFQPGTLSRWHLSYEELAAVNPRLIMLSVTGFGQEGPYRDRPGFGTLAEAMSGYAALTGFPDSPPLLPSFPLADGTTGLYGAMTVLAAIYERDQGGSGRGQHIDLAIYEPLLRLLEPAIMEYDLLGISRQRTGNRIPDTAPRNAYRTADDHWVALSGSAQPIAERILAAIGRPELAADERFATAAARVQHVDELDAVIGDWIGSHTLAEVQARFNAEQAALAPIYDLPQILTDEHFRARHNFISVADPDLAQVTMTNVLGRFSRTPGGVRFTGGPKGADTIQILHELGYSDEQMRQLEAEGVV